MGTDRWGYHEHAQPLECFQVTSPIITTHGLAIDSEIVEEYDYARTYAMYLMKHTFGNSYGKPFVSEYAQPFAVTLAY